MVKTQNGIYSNIKCLLLESVSVLCKKSVKDAILYGSEIFYADFINSYICTDIVCSF